MSQEFQSDSKRDYRTKMIEGTIVQKALSLSQRHVQNFTSMYIKTGNPFQSGSVFVTVTGFQYHVLLVLIEALILLLQLVSNNIVVSSGRRIMTHCVIEPELFINTERKEAASLWQTERQSYQQIFSLFLRYIFTLSIQSEKTLH